jgi:hypothetical protein
MSAIASWKTRENCVDCGFPCRRDGCRYYPAGVLLKCDRCGDEWAVNPGSIEAEGEDHFCEICRREIETGEQA